MSLKVKICDELKSAACSLIDSRKEDLYNISHEIWSHPEIDFEEHFAHDLLTSFLEEEGFDVSKKTPLETSFIAKYGKNDGLKIGIICEYDALPGIGHACGHNLIAEAGIAAALGLKHVLDVKPSLNAQLIVFGTPAEEGGGGKCLMIEKGSFDEVDICMMSHPAPYEILALPFVTKCFLDIVFTGKASHAAAAPWEGINALDAAVACYNNVSMLRQQIKPTDRIHGIFTDGGEKPNIIPERASLSYNIRSRLDSDFEIIYEKVINCAKGAAQATGCTVDIQEVGPRYLSIKTNDVMNRLYENNAKLLGVQFNDAEKAHNILASTDMGNVSKIKPSIHPVFRVETNGPNHTREFTKAAGSKENQLPTLNSGKSMAMTAIDVMCNPGLINEIKKDFML